MPLQKTITIKNLRSQLEKIVEKRRKNSDLLEAAPRKDRKLLLEQHRKIKATEYSLGIQLAEKNLSFIEKSKNKDKFLKGTKKVRRLRSRLDHDDWLSWTRSIWKFKEMESTAKTGKHPAQFSSKVPERLIRMYTFLGETVLDPFVGTGTTCAEALRLGRSSIGLDINQNY